MRKISEKSKLRDILQNTGVVLLKIVEIIKKKESLRNCHIPEEPKEDMTTKYDILEQKRTSG